MPYELAFHPEALREWWTLIAGIREQFKKKFEEKFEESTDPNPNNYFADQTQSQLRLLRAIDIAILCILTSKFRRREHDLIVVASWPCPLLIWSVDLTVFLRLLGVLRITARQINARCNRHPPDANRPTLEERRCG